VEKAMKSRGLTIAVVILAALTWALYWSQRQKTQAPAPAAAVNSALAILKVNMPDVMGLEIKSKGAEPVVLKKTGDKWEITGPASYPADQEAVIGLVAGLSFLNADRVVDEKASDRSQYGLASPVVELDVTQKANDTQKLLIGDDTPAGGDTYAALASGTKVFTIASYNKTSLNKSLNDLRDKSLLSLNPDKVSKIELLKKPQTIEFDRTKDGWQILKPSPSPANTAAVNDLVHAVVGARMDLTATDAPAQFARATPLATARLTGDGGTQTLEVRKSQSNYYAKSSAVSGTYKVDPSLGAALDKNVEDFQQKKQAPAAAQK
jgi:hypothetical protein